MRRFTILLAVTALAVGCGTNEPKLVPVSVMVTLNGKPLRDGDIYLYAPGKPPQAFHVDNGSIDGIVPVGSYRVEIARYVPDPDPRKAAAGIDITNALPARYSTSSTLTAEVSETSRNQFTFAITSK